VIQLLIIGVLFVIFMVAETYLFVRNERNRSSVFALSPGARHLF
jgi:hypothetical protein